MFYSNAIQIRAFYDFTTHWKKSGSFCASPLLSLPQVWKTFCLDSWDSRTVWGNALPSVGKNVCVFGCIYKYFQVQTIHQIQIHAFLWFPIQIHNISVFKYVFCPAKHRHSPGLFPLQKVGDTPKQGTTPVKPLSHRERCFVQRQAIFLLRNITKVRRMRQTKPPLTLPLVANRYHAPTQTDGTLGRESFFSKTDVFMTQLTALRNPRSVKTRYAVKAAESELAIKIRISVESK